MSLSVVWATAPCLAAVSDDFDDGDDAGWSHFDPTGGATFDASTSSYAISVLANNAPLTPPRAGSTREEQSFGDVLVIADVVAWDGLVGHSFGLVARAAAAPDRDLYALTYQLGFFHELRLVRLDDGVQTTLAAIPITLSPSHDYRLSLVVTGSNPAVLVGRVALTTTPSLPLAGVSSTDASAPIHSSGHAGIGLWDDSALANQDSSATFDDFFASDPAGDTDADGLGDGDEVNVYGTDPRLSDSDGDGLGDGDEVLVHGTLPTFADSDFDGFNDGVEISRGTDPNDPNDTPFIPVPAVGLLGRSFLIVGSICMARRRMRRAPHA